MIWKFAAIIIQGSVRRMKNLLKILACASAVYLAIRVAQLLVDVLYERYGKRYIITTDGERQPE